MNDELPDELPADFVLSRAKHLERVTADDGTEYIVLVTATDGRKVVHADIVDYNGMLEHPATTGAIGFAMILSGFLAPIIAGYLAATTFDGMLALGGAIAGLITGFGLSNVLLYHTVFGDWLYRFLEWNENKYTVMSRGETA